LTTSKTNSDLTQVLLSTQNAINALEPAINRYKRIANSNDHGVASYLVSAKSCLQSLLQATRMAQKQPTTEKAVAVQKTCQDISAAPTLDTAPKETTLDRDNGST